jgi:glycosidase
LQRRADGGEEQARGLLARLLGVGEQLGIRFPDGNSVAGDLTTAAESLLRQSFARRRVPRVTYRLQFNRGFTFRDACDLVPYLHSLVVSDCYASPLLQARAGSSHGYDILRPQPSQSEPGSPDDFDAFAAAPRRAWA